VLVSLVCRSNYGAIKEKGVQMRTRNYGEYVFRPEGVYRDVKEAAKGGEWDYVVVTTKALPDVSDDSEVIVPVVGKRTTIVLIQNGVGVEEPYKRRFPDAAVLSAVTVVSAEQVEAGVVVQNRWTRVSIGPYESGEEGRRRTEEFVGLLKAGGVKDAEVYGERALQQVRWHKIAVRSCQHNRLTLTEFVTDQRKYEPIGGALEWN